MGRRLFGDGMELVEGDLDKMGALPESELYDRVIFELIQRTENSFFGDGLKVSYVGSTQVAVNKGSGFQTDNAQVSPEPTKRLIHLAATINKSLAVPDSSNDRIDTICVKAARAVTVSESRKYKSALDQTISNQSFDVQDDWSADVIVVTGTPGISPSVPATPSGYIKIAQLLVHAVSGLGSGADVTDTRALLPVGGDVVLNTLGYQRLPAGGAVALSTLMAAIDALLKHGYLEYSDLDDLAASPAAPATDKVRLYIKNGVLTIQDETGLETTAGGGGGGGGGANWNPGETGAPDVAIENGEKVWLYGAGDAQKLTLMVKIPESFVAGKQIKAYLGAYSPSTANTMLLRTTSYLVRKNQDAISSTANSRVSTNAALTNTVANQYRQVIADLTDATGKINGFTVNPGDIIRVELARGTDTDTAEIRFIPSATEVKSS